MSYKDRIELEQLLGSFVTSPKSLLSEKEVKLLRKAMRLIGRVNKRIRRFIHVNTKRYEIAGLFFIQNR